MYVKAVDVAVMIFMILLLPLTVAIPQMKIYADSQENVSSWGSEEKGYSLLGVVVGPQWWNYVSILYPYSILATLNTVLAIILSLIVTFGLYYAIWGIAPSATGEKNFSHRREELYIQSHFCVVWRCHSPATECASVYC